MDRDYIGGLGIGLLLGGAIGLAIGILYAPRPGTETRQQIKGRVAEVVEKERELVSDVVEKGRERVSEAIEKGRNKVADVTHRMDQKIAVKSAEGD